MKSCLLKSSIDVGGIHQLQLYVHQSTIPNNIPCSWHHSGDQHIIIIFHVIEKTLLTQPFCDVASSKPFFGIPGNT